MNFYELALMFGIIVAVSRASPLEDFERNDEENGIQEVGRETKIQKPNFLLYGS